MRRFLDIVVSSAALVILSPLLVPIAIILRFTGEGEVFFKQSRVGRGGVFFGLYKFATMLKDSPNLGTGTVTVKGDPRILPIGRFLRKTKINELPQLLNIFLGEMSIIGPRPQTRRCFNAFPPKSQSVIQTVRPGLSGIGSIVFRDEDEMMDSSNDADHIYDHFIMPYKGELEEWYVRNQSVFIDIILMCLTLWVVIFPASTIVWRAFPSLPEPPKQLKVQLKHPDLEPAKCS